MCVCVCMCGGGSAVIIVGYQVERHVLCGRNV